MIFAGLSSGVPGNGPAEFNVFPSQVISPRAFQMKQGDDSKDFLQGLWSLNWYIFVCLFYSDLHCVAKEYAVLPFYDVKCLCSGGREWGREESHSH